MPTFHAEAPQTTVIEGLAQGLYMAVKAGVVPMTLQMKGVDSTKAPPRPTLRLVANQLHQYNVSERKAFSSLYSISTLPSDPLCPVVFCLRFVSELLLILSLFRSSATPRGSICFRIFLRERALMLKYSRVASFLATWFLSECRPVEHDTLPIDN